jgi:hypothetical protein
VESDVNFFQAAGLKSDRKYDASVTLEFFDPSICGSQKGEDALTDTTACTFRARVLNGSNDLVPFPIVLNPFERTGVSDLDPQTTRWTRRLLLLPIIVDGDNHIV